MEDSSPVVIDLTGADIHAEAERIREHGPVGRVELPQGVQAWSITGYEAGRQALADPRFSKDGRRHWTAFVNGEIDPRFPLISWAVMENMATAYGSAHTRLRRLVAKAFTPRRVEAMRATVETSVARLLNDLADSPPGAIVDLKSRYAHPLAAEVMFELIGVPAAARQTILRGGEVQIDTTMTEEEIAASEAEVLREMAELVEAKRRTPVDDLASDLIGAQEGEDGPGLDDVELIGTLLLLLGTGTEPVTNLVTNAVLALLANPDQRQLIDAGQASWQDAIEETLRMDAPVAQMPFRFGVEDVQLGDVTIPAGDPVLVNFAAMGRDPSVHGPNAGSFDLSRPDKKNLAFGHGMYVCLGMRLALLETQTAVPALFGRFPDLALAVAVEELKPQQTFIMNGRSELPVLLSATRQ